MKEIEAIATVRVADFGAFWDVFSTRGLAVRQAHGSQGVRVYRSLDDPNALTLVFRWSSAAALERFRTDATVRETMAASGVMRPPQWTIVELAGELPG